MEVESAQSTAAQGGGRHGKEMGGQEAEHAHLAYVEQGLL